MHGSITLKLALALTALVVVGQASAQGLDKLIASCETCHGKDGNSPTADVPIIAGFSREGFVSTIDPFSRGRSDRDGVPPAGRAGNGDERHRQGVGR